MEINDRLYKDLISELTKADQIIRILAEGLPMRVAALVGTSINGTDSTLRSTERSAVLTLASLLTPQPTLQSDQFWYAKTDI